MSKTNRDGPRRLPTVEEILRDTGKRIEERIALRTVGFTDEQIASREKSSNAWNKFVQKLREKGSEEKGK